RPSSAQRSAVAAATVVLPTPHLPVNRMVRAFTPRSPPRRRAPRRPPTDAAGATTGARRDVGSPRLDERLEIGERRLEDPRLGSPLDDPGYGQDEVDRQLVDHLGRLAVALAVGKLDLTEVIGAVELALQITGFE